MTSRVFGRTIRTALAALALTLLLMPRVALAALSPGQAEGFPPEGWSREQLIGDYSRLTGAASAAVSGDTLLVAYSFGEYDALRIVAKAYKLGPEGAKEAWTTVVSKAEGGIHNTSPSVVPAGSGGFHVFWVERPDEERYAIRYSRLGPDGKVQVEDTTLEYASGPIRDLTGAELPDGTVALAWSDWRGRKLEVMAAKLIERNGAPLLSGKVSYMGTVEDKAISTPRICYVGKDEGLALVWVESGFDEAGLVLAWLDQDSLAAVKTQNLGPFSTASGSYPAIAADGEQGLYVAWPQDMNAMSFTATRTSDIMLAYFDGRRLAQTAKVVGLPEDQTAPAVAADSSGVYIAWHDFSERSPHVWIGKFGKDGAAYYGPLKIDYNLMASVRPIVFDLGGKALAIYERFTSEGPRQAYLMSQLNPANPSVLFSLGIKESDPVKHLAFTLAMAALRAGMNVMLNIGAFAAAMAFIWLLGKAKLAAGLKDRPELFAAALILFLMALQATPLVVALPEMYGPDFHVLISILAGISAYWIMKLGRSDWWLDSLTQLVFMCLWMFLQQYAMLIPSVLKAGLV